MLWRPEGEGRARAGWLRAGLASPRGGKAGGRAPGPLAHSFAPSLRGWVSQSVGLPAAGGPASRRGPEPRTPAPPAIVRRAAAAVGAGARASEPPVRRGGGGGARAWCVCVCVCGCGAVPEGTVLVAAAAPQPLCLQSPAGPGLGARALRPAHAGGLRGWRLDAGGLGRKAGADRGERLKVRLAVYF